MKTDRCCYTYITEGWTLNFAVRGFPNICRSDAGLILGWTKNIFLVNFYVSKCLNVCRTVFYIQSDMPD